MFSAKQKRKETNVSKKIENVCDNIMFRLVETNTQRNKEEMLLCKRYK